jgi:hypothetical protein
MTSKKTPKPDTMENVPVEEKVKLMLAGVNFHLRNMLSERIEKSKLVTNTFTDSRRWELESLLAEIIKYQFVVSLIESIIRFL